MGVVRRRSIREVTSGVCLEADVASESYSATAVLGPASMGNTSGVVHQRCISCGKGASSVSVLPSILLSVSFEQCSACRGAPVASKVL